MHTLSKNNSDRGAISLPSSSEHTPWSKGDWRCLILLCRWAVPSSQAFCTTSSLRASSGCWWRLWCSSLWSGTWKWWITSVLETSRCCISAPLAMGSQGWWWLSLLAYNRMVMGCIIGKWHSSLSLKIIAIINYSMVIIKWTHKRAITGAVVMATIYWALTSWAVGLRAAMGNSTGCASHKSGSHCLHYSISG